MLRAIRLASTDNDATAMRRLAAPLCALLITFAACATEPAADTGSSSQTDTTSTTDATDAQTLQDSQNPEDSGKSQPDVGPAGSANDTSTCSCPYGKTCAGDTCADAPQTCVLPDTWGPATNTPRPPAPARRSPR